MSGILSAFIGRVAGVVTDAYFNLVTLLLPGNGTNGAQNNTFLDSSTNNFTITRNGNTTQGTFSPFSQTGWSVNLDGTGDYLTVADNAVLDMGSSNFTMEFWTYVTGTPSTYQAFLSKRASTGVYGGIELYLTSGRALNLQATLNGSSWGVDITTSSTINLNEWVHIAIVRNGNVWTVYINGTSGASTTVSGTVPDNSSAFTIGAGAADGGHNMVAAYISNFRLVKGTALYTANFTPSTSALTTTSQGATATEVELLTCQGNRFVDISDNAFTITVNGNPSVQAFSPFAPTAAYSAATVGGSGYFDGTGDYLTGSTNTATAFNLTGNFTIECWAYFNSVATSFAGLVSWADSSGWNGWQFLNNAGTLTFEFLTGSAGAGTTTSSAGALTTGRWFHLAAVRSGSTITLYINGVSRGTSTYSSSQTSSSSFIKVAADRLGTALTTGYIADLRIVNGTAVYTAGFTPPTAPLTAITNTSLLLNFTNAGITDATAKNVLETVGNAQISTTQSKFGGSSMYFDGTGDGLTIPSNPHFAFQTGDFTIEFWAYFNSIDNNDTIYIHGNTTNTVQLFFVSGKLRYNNNSVASILDTATTISTGQWIHLAICRSGTTARWFINGTQDASTTDTTNWSNSSTALTIGRDPVNSGRDMNGYINDLRVSRYARYTANFTAPTTAFPTR